MTLSFHCCSSREIKVALVWIVAKNPSAKIHQKPFLFACQKHHNYIFEAHIFSNSSRNPFVTIHQPAAVRKGNIWSSHSFCPAAHLTGACQKYCKYFFYSYLWCLSDWFARNITNIYFTHISASDWFAKNITNVYFTQICGADIYTFIRKSSDWLATNVNQELKKTQFWRNFSLLVIQTKY